MFNLLLQPVLAPLMRCRMPSASLPHPASSGLQYLDASPSSLCVYQGTRGILWCKCLQDAGRADKEHLGRIANRRGKWEDRGRGLTASICPGTGLVGSRPHSGSSIGCENDKRETPQQQLRVHSRFSPSMAQLQPVSRAAVLHRTSPTLPALVDWGCCLQSPQGPLDSQHLPAHMCARLQSGSPCNVESSEQLARKWLGKLGPGGRFPSGLAPRGSQTCRGTRIWISGPGGIPHLKRPAARSRRPIPTNLSNLSNPSNFTTCRRSLARCNPLDPATGSVLNPHRNKPGLPAELGHHRSAGATTASSRGHSGGQRAAVKLHPIHKSGDNFSGIPCCSKLRDPARLPRSVGIHGRI